jgi:O-antigen ligase
MKKYFWFNIGILGLVLILLPNFSPFTDISYNSKRIFQVCFLVVVILQLIFVNQYFDEFRKEWNSVSTGIKNLIYAVGSLGIISALFSALPFYAFMEIGLYILILILILSVAFWYKTYPDLFIKSVGVILSLMVVLYFIRFSINYIYNFLYPSWPVWPNTQLVQIMVNGEPFYPDPFLGFVHPRFLNHLHTWSLPLFAMFIVNMPKKFWAYRTLLYIFTGFWWMLVFAADARGTILTSVLSLIIVAVLFRARIKEWLKTYLYTSIAGLLSYLFFFKLIIPEGSRTVLSRFGDSGRLKMWNHAIDLFKENPILGAGPMHYADISNNFNFAHPHNFYLQILSEWGIISFTLLAGLFVYLFSKWIRTSYKSGLEGYNLNIQAALTASLSAGLMHSFLSGLLHTPLSQIMAAIVFGLAIGFYQMNFIKKKSDNSENNSTFDMRSILTKTVLSGVAIFVLWGTFHSYNNLSQSRSDYIEQMDKTRFYPRFWDHGNIGID